jgi:hypothetical protein
VHRGIQSAYRAIARIGDALARDLFRRRAVSFAYRVDQLFRDCDCGSGMTK